MKWEDHYYYLECEMGRDPWAKTKESERSIEKLRRRFWETEHDEGICMAKSGVCSEDDVAQPHLGEGFR